MFSIGVDLGQRRDYSAVAVVERLKSVACRFDPVQWAWRERDLEDESVVRHLERMPLGTPYTAVTERVVEMARSPKLGGERRLVVDATGVGMPVVDMPRAARPGCEISAVWITGGESERFDGAVARAETGALGTAANAAGNETAAHCGADARGRDAGAGVARYPIGKTGERAIEDRRGRRGRTRRSGAGRGARGLGGQEGGGGTSGNEADRDIETPSAS
jgi:hypothetical protein